MAIFLYSHYFSAWYCTDIVRRNSVLVTHRSYPKWSTDLIPRKKKRTAQNFKKICACLETRSLKMESRNDSLVTRSTVNWHLTLTYRQKAFWPQPSENFFGGITRTAIWSNFGFSAKKKLSEILSVLLFFALWLVKKTHVTLSNAKPKPITTKKGSSPVTT